MPLDGNVFSPGPVVTEPTPAATPTGSRLEDLMLRRGTEVSITNNSGGSIVGTPLTTESLWQQWNLTLTNSTSTTNVIQMHPQSVTNDISTGTTEIVWRSWNNDIITGTATNGHLDLSITTNTTATGSIVTAQEITVTNSSPSTITFTNEEAWRGWNRPAPRVWQQMDPAERAAHEETERQAYEERREQARAQREEAQAKRAEAAEKAEKLLMTCLTAEQQMQWRTRKCFYVTSKTGRRYRFDSNTYQGNVKLVNRDDVVLSTFCIHLPHTIPLCDHLLAQKLMLEADEPTFMRIANEAVRGGTERVSDLILAAA